LYSKYTYYHSYYTPSEQDEVPEDARQEFAEVGSTGDRPKE
jgi:hypothetical protein